MSSFAAAFPYLYHSAGGITFVKFIRHRLKLRRQSFASALIFRWVKFTQNCEEIFFFFFFSVTRIGGRRGVCEKVGRVERKMWWKEKEEREREEFWKQMRYCRLFNTIRKKWFSRNSKTNLSPNKTCRCCIFLRPFPALFPFSSLFYLLVLLRKKIWSLNCESRMATVWSCRREILFIFHFKLFWLFDPRRLTFLSMCYEQRLQLWLFWSKRIKIFKWNGRIISRIVFPASKGSQLEKKKKKNVNKLKGLRLFVLFCAWWVAGPFDSTTNTTKGWHNILVELIQI